MGTNVINERITVVPHENSTAFRHEKSGELFSSLSFPCSGQKDDTRVATLNIIRNGTVYEEGRYGFFNRDEEGFILPKTMASFCDQKGWARQDSTHDLVPEMFETGDTIMITHNCPTPIESMSPLYKKEIREGS